MVDPNGLTIDGFVTHVVSEFDRLFDPAEPAQYATLEEAAATALSTLTRCDCPYHDVAHTQLVVDAGMSILAGRQQTLGDLSSRSWMQAVIAMLYHDIGYIRVLLPQDDASGCVVDASGNRVAPPEDATDAFMTPYHVTRGQVFLHSLFPQNKQFDLTATAACIEMTRFPVPADEAYQQTATLPGLVRAADLIGQLADPDYRRKLPRLYKEFEEIGENERLGIHSVEELHHTFPEFFYSQVQPYIGPAVEYLKCVETGRQWIANLYQRLEQSCTRDELAPDRRAPELRI